MDLTGLGGLATLGSEIVNRIWPDATEVDKQKISLALAELTSATELAKAQSEVNKTEAGHSSVFVSGWRPATGWVCVAAMSYQFILYPLLMWLTVFYPDINVPEPLFSNMLWELMFGMLGLAGWRSWEKTKGVAR